jgi:hypothetical protein
VHAARGEWQQAAETVRQAAEAWEKISGQDLRKGLVYGVLKQLGIEREDFEKA